jgi:hypothetical protein
VSEFTEDQPEPDAHNVQPNTTVNETSRPYETTSGDDQSSEAAKNWAALDGVEELDGIRGPIRNTLSNDDEADLMRELADIECHYKIKPTPQKRRCALPETDSTTISRILNKTDKLFREPSGRRSAMAEMKAAVAVIEALSCVDKNGEGPAHFTSSRQEPLKFGRLAARLLKCRIPHILMSRSIVIGLKSRSRISLKTMVACGTRCLIPRFDGAICSLEWKEALWDKYVTAAPRPRTQSEQQYSDPLADSRLLANDERRKLQPRR